VIPNRLTDVVAICLRDPALAARYAARLAHGDGWDVVAPHPSWVMVTRPLGTGTVPDRTPLVLEGWPDLVRWQGSAEAGHAALARAVDQRRWTDVPGDVGFLHVAVDGTAVAARAPAGRIPLYVHGFADGVVLSTRLDRLLCLRPEWPWQIDGLVLHNWAGWTGVSPRGRTTIRGVSLVPQGHTVHLAPGDRIPRVPQRFWDPRPDAIPRRSDAGEYGERLRALVVRHLEDELDPGGANLLALSGGVDSSTLAVAAHVLVGRRYQAVSNVPVNPVDRSLEERYLGIVARLAPPVGHVRYAWTPEEDLRVFSDGPPVGLPVIHPVLLKLGELQRRMPSVAYFGGEWGDASCGAGAPRA